MTTKYPRQEIATHQSCLLCWLFFCDFSLDLIGEHVVLASRMLARDADVNDVLDNVRIMDNVSFLHLHSLLLGEYIQHQAFHT